MGRIVVWIALAVLGAGCQTLFLGNAKVPNGPDGCRTQCGKWGMELAGMVTMGEYSDGCICQVKGAAAASGQAPMSAVGAAVGPAVAGVIVQMQEEQRQRDELSRPFGR